MNRRDFIGLFGKALAGAAFAPGIANSIDIPQEAAAQGEAVTPVSLRYVVDMGNDYSLCPEIAAELNFSDGRRMRKCFVA